MYILYIRHILAQKTNFPDNITESHQSGCSIQTWPCGHCASCWWCSVNQWGQPEKACLGIAVQNKESLSPCQLAWTLTPTSAYDRRTQQCQQKYQQNKNKRRLFVSAKRELPYTAHTTNTRTNQQVNKWYAPQKNGGGGAFVCHSGQCAKHPDSLEHAIKCQLGGVCFVSCTAAAQTGWHALTNNPHSTK